jgi:acyl-CoA dehydrogenase
MSMLIVPTDTPGVEILRNVGVGIESEDHWSHAHIRYDNVRVPADHMLGAPGSAFVIAQTRLGGGRIHHAMRTVAQVRKAFDMLCERALSRRVRNGRLAEFQMTQEKIADSWIDLEQFRLLVLRTAWKIDRYHDYKKVRGDIAAIKVLTPRVLHDVTQRAMQIHGALGVSNDMPFVSMLISAYSLGIADGPTEVHKITLAKQILRDYRGSDDLFPSYHIPTLRETARARFAELLEAEIGNL